MAEEWKKAAQARMIVDSDGTVRSACRLRSCGGAVLQDTRRVALYTCTARVCCKAQFASPCDCERDNC